MARLICECRKCAQEVYEESGSYGKVYLSLEYHNPGPKRYVPLNIRYWPDMALLVAKSWYQ